MMTQREKEEFREEFLWRFRNLRNIEIDREVAHLRKPADQMSDEEILRYIESKDPDIIFDSWDDEREKDIQKNVLRQGPYALSVIYPKLGPKDTRQVVPPNPQIMIALFRAGYSRYTAESIAAQCGFFGSISVASGDLDFIEDFQRKLEDLGLTTKIRYRDPN